MTNDEQLPSGWALTRVCDLYDILAGGTPSTAVEEYWNGTIPWITSADIHGLKDIRPRRRITPGAVNNSATNLVPAGSIIVVTRVSLGKLALTQHPLCFSQDSQALIGDHELILSDYALYYLSKAVEVFRHRSRGTTISGVTKKQLAELPFLLSPLPEQYRIVAKIEELFTRLEAGVEALKRTKALLKRYRQSVLKSAVEGRLTQEWREAHKGELEPASKLLERISQERRRRFVEKARDGVRAYVAARVSGAAVHNNPRDILQAFLTEMVVNDIDLSHSKLLDALIASFFEAMEGDVGGVSRQRRAAASRSGEPSYLEWSQNAFDALHAEDLDSEVLAACSVTPCGRPGPEDGDKPLRYNTSEHAMMEAIRAEGAAHLRRTLIEEPADRNWKADEAKRKANQPDTSQLPELPDGWEWTTLPQMGELNRGKSKHRPRDATFLYGGPYPFVQTGDVKNANGYVRSFTQTYSEEGLRQSRLWQANTLCITIAANIADTAILGFEACFPDSIVGFTTDAPWCNVQFVEFFVRTVKSAIEVDAPATAQKNINLATLSRLPIRFPPLAEQQRIVEEVDRRLSIADEVEATIDANLKRAERLRQAILKQAFEGKLVPQDPNDEPASLLLEKIREEKTEREAERARAKRKPKPSGSKKKGKSVAKAPPQISLPIE